MWSVCGLYARSHTDLYVSLSGALHSLSVLRMNGAMAPALYGIRQSMACVFGRTNPHAVKTASHSAHWTCMPMINKMQ
jgi:hypothetical protein